MFVDEITVKLIAGKGGDGCTSFHHEKCILHNTSRYYHLLQT